MLIIQRSVCQIACEVGGWVLNLDSLSCERREEKCSDAPRSLSQQHIQVPPPQDPTQECRQATQLPLLSKDLGHRFIRVTIQASLQVEQILRFRLLEAGMKDPRLVLMNSVSRHHRHVVG